MINDYDILNHLLIFDQVLNHSFNSIDLNYFTANYECKRERERGCVRERLKEMVQSGDQIYSD